MNDRILVNIRLKRYYSLRNKELVKVLRSVYKTLSLNFYVHTFECLFNVLGISEGGDFHHKY